MKKLKITLFISAVISVILEALPYGAVCNFATPEETIRKTFSYFSLTPFGYANFGPFLTACLSCLLLIFALLMLCGIKKRIGKIAAVTAIISVLTSFLPLMFGIDYYSVIGGFISALMIIQYAVIFAINKNEVAK